MYHIYSLLSPIFIGTQNKLYIILSVENCKNLRKNKKIFKYQKKFLYSLKKYYNDRKKLQKVVELSTKILHYKNIVEKLNYKGGEK